MVVKVVKGELAQEKMYLMQRYAVGMARATHRVLTIIGLPWELVNATKAG
jgi:hypothetical protein